MRDCTYTYIFCYSTLFGELIILNSEQIIVKGDIGETTEDLRLPMQPRQFRPPGFFSFLNPPPGND
jgi:hypothetical protein